jgi:hypothetical protein
MNVRPCKKYGDDHEYDFPEKGMRQTHTVAAFSSCRWVMTLGGDFQQSKFNTLNDTLNSLLVSPETQCSLVSIILYDESHFRGISLDLKIHKEITQSLMECIKLQ